MLATILITGDPEIARDAEQAGVSRIMVDLESIGKKERQASRNTFISSHRKEDVAAVRGAIARAQLIVRVNPWHGHSPQEIDHAIAHGANFIMLPMITDMRQFDAYASHVAGRARLLPLVETAYSMEHIGEIASHTDVEELYIGLNDLHLSLGMDFLFEPLAGGLLDSMASLVRKHGKRFGFGGIAKMGSGELPADYILAEHQRLGSSCVILSSRFCKDVEIGNPEGRSARIAGALQTMHDHFTRCAARDAQQQQADFARTASIIRQLAQEARARRAASGA